MRVHTVVLLCCACLLSACATRTFSTVTPVPGTIPAILPAPAGFVYSPSQNSYVPLKAFPPWVKAPSSILVTQNDITNRPYRPVGDITVSIAKWLIFNSDPTPEDINEELQSKAAEMGADAVVLVRYGTTGVGVVTWGKLEGRGRAVVFEN